jgi:fructokinase
MSSRSANPDTADKTATIVSFGEVLWDLLPTGPLLGGAPFNFAFRASTFGHRAVIVSRLGRDDRGREAFARISALGMETGWIQWDDTAPTGTVNVRFDEKGNHDFTITPDVAYDHIAASEELLQLGARADCLCFGTLVRRSPTSRSALDMLLEAFEGRLVLLDLNLRKDCWTDAEVISSIASADVLKLNDQELLTVDRIFSLPAGTMPEKALALVKMTNLRCAVVTLGEGGACAVSGAGEIVYEPGYVVAPVDTIGSGDAFTAGFIHALLADRPLSEACRLGNALGALVTGQRGATESLSPDRIDLMLSRGERRPADPRFA